jgi:hypothetical protein
MNFFKKALCLLALCAINSMDARTAKKATPAARRTTPATRRTAAQPAMGGNTIQQLRMNALAKNNINPTTKLFNDKWMMDTAQAAQKAGIGQVGLRFVLQATRDKYMPLTGNDETDAATLRGINRQIENVVVTLQ